MEHVLFVVRSDRLHVGNVPHAWCVAKETGVPVQHLRADGSAVVVMWYEKGRRRQSVRTNYKVEWVSK